MTRTSSFLRSLTTGGLLVASALAMTATPASALPTETSTCSVPATADGAVLVTLKHVLDREDVVWRVRLATYEAAWVESHANDLDCGDADSVGVFQQRASTGWTHAGNPELATFDFLHGNPSDSSAGAIEVARNNPTWSAGQIAQAVQRSAFPDRYDDARGTAENLIDRAGSLDVVDRSVSAVVKSDGNPLVFTRDNTTGRLKIRGRTGSAWDEHWNQPDNTTTKLGSGPDAATRAAGYYDVVARGMDGKVLLASKKPDQEWQNFAVHSSFATEYAPSIVAVDSSTLLVFAVRSGDGAMMKRRWEQGSGWEDAWSRIGDEGGFTSGPDAAKKHGLNAVAVAVRGGNGNIRVFHWANNVWDGTADFWGAPEWGVREGGAPAIASRATGSLDVMVLGPGGSVFRKVKTGGTVAVDWHRPANVNNDGFSYGPDLVANTDLGALSLFGRDSDGDFVISNLRDGAWSPLHAF